MMKFVLQNKAEDGGVFQPNFHQIKDDDLELSGQNYDYMNYFYDPNDRVEWEKIV